MRNPSNNEITLNFGATSDPYSPASPHRGTDFAYVPDDGVYAPADGVVIVRPNNGNDGNAIYMTIGDEFHGFLHLSSFLVQDGQHVKEGQKIGIMGATGLAIGRHLHWAVKQDSQFIDPMSLNLKEEDMPTRTYIINNYLRNIGREPTDDEINTWLKNGWEEASNGIWDAPENGQRPGSAKWNIAYAENATKVIKEQNAIINQLQAAIADKREGDTKALVDKMQALLNEFSASK